MIKIPMNVGWFDTKDFDNTLVKIMVILSAFDPYLKDPCNPSYRLVWCLGLNAWPRHEVPQLDCAMSGSGGPRFTVIKFFRAVLRMVPFLQLFWQTQEAVS